MKMGVIGLGHMGSHMAEHLIKAGHQVCVYDVVPAATDKLVKMGATASSVSNMAAQVDMLITMVQTSQQVHDLCMQPDGIFPHAQPDLLYIDCSSIDITMTRQLHAEATHRKLAMLDAPVSGGVAGAAAGSLLFMVGGDKADFDRAEPVLKQMGRKIIYAGQAGSGQAAKICNNLILGISMIAVSEGFNLAEKLGLDPHVFYEISSNGSGQCWSMVNNCPYPHILDHVPSSHGYQPGFMANMMLKDLRLAHHAAEAVNAAIPMASTAAELYELFVNQGQGQLDFSGIIQLIAGQSGKI